MGDTVNTVYKNANVPIEARVIDLLPRMTLKEKLGQMTQIERAVASPDVIRDICIDPDLVERIGAATALETGASGVQYAFSN